jgi:hypothetical protein
MTRYDKNQATQHAASLRKMADQTLARADLTDDERQALQFASDMLRHVLDLENIFDGYYALATDLESAAGKPFDPDGPLLLENLMLAAFLIGAYAADNPITRRMVKLAKAESIARARTYRKSLTNDEVLALAVPLWEASGPCRKSAEATADAIVQANPSVDMQPNSLAKRLRPLMRERGLLDSRPTK